MSEDRPPSYASKATVARELDVSESQIDELTRRGILPAPLRLSSGCVRWCWADVTTALGSLKKTGASDPYLAAVQEQQGGTERKKGQR
jgi:predicted DNA-binding transcriptional regulator AlpA